MSTMGAMGQPKFWLDELLVSATRTAAEGAGVVAAAGAKVVIVCQLAATVRAVTVRWFRHSLDRGWGNGQGQFLLWIGILV